MLSLPLYTGEGDDRFCMHGKLLFVCNGMNMMHAAPRTLVPPTRHPFPKAFQFVHFVILVDYALP